MSSFWGCGGDLGRGPRHGLGGNGLLPGARDNRGALLTPRRGTLHLWRGVNGVWPKAEDVATPETLALVAEMEYIHANPVVTSSYGRVLKPKTKFSKKAQALAAKLEKLPEIPEGMMTSFSGVLSEHV